MVANTMNNISPALPPWLARLSDITDDGNTSSQFRRGRPLLVNKAHPKPASGIVRRYTNQPSKNLKFSVSREERTIKVLAGRNG